MVDFRCLGQIMLDFRLCCISGRVVVWSGSSRSLVHVQAPSFPCGYHLGVCSLVLQIWDGISYRDLAEMMQERGVDMDPSTIMRWVHRYAPELERRVRWYQGYRATSWRVDETYVRVGGHWKYLFRAGRLIDFMLMDRRNTRAAHRFLGKALTTMRHWPPSSITTDQLGSYPKSH